MTPNDPNGAAAVSDGQLRTLHNLARHLEERGKILIGEKMSSNYRRALLALLAAAGKQADVPGTLTAEQRELIKNAAEVISEAVTFDQDGFDSAPMPATAWDYSADQLAYALRAMLDEDPTQPATPEALPVKADSDVSGAQVATAKTADAMLLNDEQRVAIQECIDYLHPAAKDFSDLGLVGMDDSKHARCVRTLRSILAAAQPENGGDRG